MLCPKCGFEQPDHSETCPRCGVIFSKIKERSANSGSVATGKDVKLPGNRGRIKRRPLIGVITGVISLMVLAYLSCLYALDLEWGGRSSQLFSRYLQTWLVITVVLFTLSLVERKRGRGFSFFILVIFICCIVAHNLGILLLGFLVYLPFISIPLMLLAFFGLKRGGPADSSNRDK